MNISIFASIWCQNLWDELIVKNEIELLRKEISSTQKQDKASSNWQDINFRVASYDPCNPVFNIPDVQYFEYFPIAIRSKKNIFRNIKNLYQYIKTILWSDMVVIGWWGIIYDNEFQSVWNPLRQWLVRVKIARFFRKKIYFYAVWIDITYEENFHIVKNIFKHAYKITVRDIKSQEQLKNIWIHSEVVDDPVMHENNWKWIIYKTFSSHNFSLKDFTDIDFKEKEVWLALRRGYIGKSKNFQIEKLLVQELCVFIEQRGWKIVFLPHSFHPSDSQANDYIFMKEFLQDHRQIKKTLWEVYEWYKENVYQDNTSILAKKEKILISMRLHSIILASVYNISQVILSYSEKTHQVIYKLSKKE